MPWTTKSRLYFQCFIYVFNMVQNCLTGQQLSEKHFRGGLSLREYLSF